MPPRPARSLLDHPVTQHPDALYFELDDVTGLQEPQLLEAAAVADGPRAEELAGMQRLGAGDVRDAVLELPLHVARVAAPPFLTVHPHLHLEGVRIRNLVGGHHARPHRVRVVEVLALAGAELAGHLSRLLVARREVVEDRIAEDMVARSLTCDVPAGATDVAAELEFEVERLAVVGPWYLVLVPANAEPVRMVEDRPLVPGPGYGEDSLRLHLAQRGFGVGRGLCAELPRRLEGLHEMFLEAEEVAHLRRLRDRCGEPHVGAREYCRLRHTLRGRERSREVERVLAAFCDRDHAREPG